MTVGDTLSLLTCGGNPGGQALLTVVEVNGAPVFVPLALGIESVFFRVLGDHILVENLYSLFTAIVTGALIVGLWRLLTSGPEAARV